MDFRPFDFEHIFYIALGWVLRDIMELIWRFVKGINDKRSKTKRKK